MKRTSIILIWLCLISNCVLSQTNAKKATCCGNFLINADTVIDYLVIVPLLKEMNDTVYYRKWDVKDEHQAVLSIMHNNNSIKNFTYFISTLKELTLPILRDSLRESDDIIPIPGFVKFGEYFGIIDNSNPMDITTFYLYKSENNIGLYFSSYDVEGGYRFGPFITFEIKKDGSIILKCKDGDCSGFPKKLNVINGKFIEVK